MLVKNAKNVANSCISQYCRKIHNVAIYALFKAILWGGNPAIRQFWTLCNSGCRGEERGGGGQQPLLSAPEEGEGQHLHYRVRVVMQKNISAYPPSSESFNKKPKDWKNAMTMAEMALKNTE